MTWRRNELGVPRLGLAVAARTAGNAIARNRVRRLVRESFRLAQGRLPAVDLVIGVRNGVSDAPREQLRGQLEKLWTRLAQASV